MKDQIIAILEALRLSQAALAKHSEPGGPTAEVTVKALRHFLLDRHVIFAVEMLSPSVESPATSPVVKIDRSGASQKASRSQAKKGKKRIEGQREMLLPISGKKGKEAAKPVARPATRRKAG
jgi:hypothetical protein